MIKILLLTMTMGLISSCSHHHAKEAHHHHDCAENCSKDKKSPEDKFQHKCAESIAEGDIHIEGKEEFKIEHAGRVYYFSSKQKMDKFSKNLEKNVEIATKNWDHEHDHMGKK